SRMFDSMSAGTFVLLGRGDATFRPPAPLGELGALEEVVVADMDRDGHADLVETRDEFPSRVVVRLGRGDGTFAPAARYGAGGGAARLAHGDFNGDGWPDVAMTDPYGQVTILDGIGGGALRSIPTFNPRQVAVATADLDGDGRSDLLVSSV